MPCLKGNRVRPCDDLEFRRLRRCGCEVPLGLYFSCLSAASILSLLQPQKGPLHVHTCVLLVSYKKLILFSLFQCRVWQSRHSIWLLFAPTSSHDNSVRICYEPCWFYWYTCSFRHMLQPSMVSWHPSCSPPLIHDKKIKKNVFCVQNMAGVGGGYLNLLNIKSWWIQTNETAEDTLYKKTKIRLQITMRQLTGRRWGNLEIWNHGNNLALSSTKTKEAILEARATIDLSASQVIQSFKFLEVHISQDLSWPTNTSSVSKKSAQRLCFLRTQMKSQLMQLLNSLHHLPPITTPGLVASTSSIPLATPTS